MILLGAIAAWLASQPPVEADPTPRVRTAMPTEAQYAGPCFFDRAVRLGGPEGPMFLLHLCAGGEILLKPDMGGR